MFALVVRFEVRPGHLPAFDELVARTRADIAAHEPDTLVYTSHERADQPGERVFYEAYRDRAAFLAHEASEHTQRFLAERTQHLVADPEVWWLSAVEPAIS